MGVVRLTSLVVVVAWAICVNNASAQIEKDGKKYYMTGQRVGVLGGKEVPVTLYAGAPFQAGDLAVDCELTSPLEIVVVSFENGWLIPTAESSIPLYMHFDPFAGRLESRMFTRAVNVTWRFAKSGIEFTAAGVLYGTEKDNATISFTKDGVRISGIAKKGESQVWRFDSAGETGKEESRFMAIWVMAPMSRYSIDLVRSRYCFPVPDASGHKALPPEEKLAAVLRGVKKGDLVDVYLSADKLLARIEKSSLLPNEDMPDSRVFVERTTARFNGVDFPAVTLRKYRHDETYPLGQREGGKWVPDKALAGQLGDFKRNDLVDVDLQAEEPNVLRMGMTYFVTAMVSYKAPEVGTVVKIRDKTETTPATVTLTIEGKDKTTTRYYEGLAKLEPGQQIWFRPLTKDGKDYLKFIWWTKE